MALLAVVLILICWVVKLIYDAAQPSIKHIDDMDEHFDKIISLPDEKSRQRYLKDLAKKQNKRK